MSISDLKDQAEEFALWGWTQPFRARFLLFSLLGMALIIGWQDRQTRVERQEWRRENAALQKQVEDCLKETAKKVEALQAQQIDYITKFNARQERAADEIRKVKKRIK
jgi:Na+(H+)/acetate symporter ActP